MGKKRESMFYLLRVLKKVHTAVRLIADDETVHPCGGNVKFDGGGGNVFGLDGAN